MPRYSDRRDIQFTLDGDIRVGPDGDLMGTRVGDYDGFIQAINKRLMSSRNDWALEPDVGANIAEFVGAPNTRETGDALRLRIMNELSRDNLVRAGDLSVDVLPVATSKVFVLVTVRAIGTDTIRLAYTYDLRENRLIPRN